MSEFHNACREGDLESVRRQLQEDPTLVDADDQHGWRPLFHAALKKQREVVALLLEQGADISAHHGDVLHYAAEVPSNQAIVTMLLQHGALESHVRPPNNLSRQLLAAIFLADDKRVECLLVLHPELATTVDGSGDHPIHHAARNGQTNLVLALLRAGADVNALGRKGHTVLYCAAGHGHCDTVKCLLRHGIDVDVAFTRDGKSVADWLEQYPGDERLVAVRQVLQAHE